MLDGECWELMMPERITSGREHGFWRTPDAGTHGNVATPNKSVINGTARKNQQIRLVDQVTMWPTPTQSDYRTGYGMSNAGKKRMMHSRGKPLRDVIFRTPTQSDANKWSNQSEMERKEKGQSVRLNHQLEVGGKLNPMWVEWLMGWPLGWTDLKPLETDKFRQWLNSHGVF
jgi:DNA (cytosine-5)-methyltransferase 1